VTQKLPFDNDAANIDWLQRVWAQKEMDIVYFQNEIKKLNKRIEELEDKLQHEYECQAGASL
jgi:hypothetical protein